MKIYNFGNDYAFQQKQKLEQETSKMNPSCLLYTSDAADE